MFWFNIFSKIFREKRGNWNLFIDDERFPSDSDNKEYVICRTVEDCIEQIKRNKRFPIFISFDHGLGDNQQTGFDLCKILVDMDMDNCYGGFDDGFDFYVHSHNPIGKENIEKYLLNYFMRKGE